MNKILTLQDFELISAYLDSACSPKELATIEARLRSDAEFAQAMAEFKRAKLMLKSIPQKRAPRNFTLSTAQVPQQFKRSAWVPALNFVALAASLFLVVIFVGTKFLSFGAGQASATEAAPMMMAAAPNDQVTESTTNPIITWGSSGGYGGGGNDMGAYAAGKGGGPTTNTVPTESVPDVSSDVVVTTSPDLTTSSNDNDTSNLILGVAPEEDRGNELATEAPAREFVPTPAPFPWVLASEIGLAAIAVVSLIISLILRGRH